jgi:ribosomal protein L11 methyltransferase
MPKESSTFWTLDAEVLPESEELWSLWCYQHGATGAQWLEERPEYLRVRYCFESLDPDAVARWVQDFRLRYPDLPPPFDLTCRQHGIEPWATRWREHFRPQPVGRRLLICPPWQRAEDNAAFAGRLRVVIDPGQGFGTGQHASTSLALELIEQAMDMALPESVLDVGTGSGILSIAACLLGARQACCVDIDGRVMPEVRKNFALSGIAAAALLAIGGPECIARAFPLVLANLSAPVLIELAEQLARLTSPGGDLILSGVLTTEFPEVQARFHALGLMTRAARQRESWTALWLNHP